MPQLGDLIKRSQPLTKSIQRKRLKPTSQQKRVLRRLLRRAAHTSFGQYYHFKEILQADKLIREYQQRVPIFDYDHMYEKWWDLTLNGVENVSWRGRIKFFALSSGTSGAPSKHIPISEDAVRMMKRGAMRLFFTLPKFRVEMELFTKGILMLGGTTDLENQNGHYLGDLSGINASKLPFWLRPYYKPGTKISRIKNWNERIEEIAKNAPNWDVGIIVGIPAWLQLVMEKIIAYHQVASIHDIWPNLKMCIHGVQAVERSLDISIPEFTVTAVRHGNFFAHEWYLGCASPGDPEVIRKILDDTLKKVNADYATERSSVLRDIRGRVLPVDLFYQYQAAEGKIGGQHKFPRVLKEDRLAAWRAFLQERTGRTHRESD